MRRCEYGSLSSLYTLLNYKKTKNVKTTQNNELNNLRAYTNGNDQLNKNQVHNISLYDN